MQVVQSVRYVNLGDVCENMNDNDFENLLEFLRETVSWGDASFTLIDPMTVVQCMDDADIDEPATLDILEKLPENTYVNVEC